MPRGDCPRLRHDLTWSRFVSEGRDSYIFKDPIALEYVRLDAVSGELTTLFDGTRTAEDMLEYARGRWPGLSFDEDYVADLLNDLKDMKYLEDPFQRHVLLQARARQERMQINAGTFRNLFSIPLGWVDPDRFLTKTYPYVSFMFKPAMVWLGMALFTAAGYVVWLNRGHVASSSGNLMLGEQNRVLGAALIWVLIMAAIVLHEFGHGFAVKHHGGKVHKLGFIVVFGMPCMFCETSDTHLWPDWKKRVQVALAGTYIELYMAAVATVVWWLTPSGLIVNQLAYNIILFASVSGILFNYNPLIKMDGYFVLSDTLGMPNLQEDAYEYLGYLFRRYVLRMKVDCPAHGRRRKRILFFYGVASIAYSVFFATLMFLFLRRLLVRSLAALGALLSVGLLLMVLRRPLKPIMRTVRLWMLESGSRMGGAGARRRFGLVAGLALAALLLLVPVPGRRAVPVTLQPQRRAALVVPEEMRVRWLGFEAGQAVAAGQVLAELNTDSTEVMRGEAEARAGELRVAVAAALQRGERAEAVLQRARARVETATSDWIGARVERAGLRAPFAGRVLSASTPGRCGALLQPGDTVCVVGDFSRPRAAAIVQEGDLDDFRAGASARVRLRARPWQGLDGRVAAIEALPLDTGATRAYRVWFDLETRRDDRWGPLRAGLTGVAHIVTPARPAAAHVVRWLARFLRVDLWV